MTPSGLTNLPEVRPDSGLRGKCVERWISVALPMRPVLDRLGFGELPAFLLALAPRTAARWRGHRSPGARLRRSERPRPPGTLLLREEPAQGDSRGSCLCERSSVRVQAMDDRAPAATRLRGDPRDVWEVIDGCAEPG